MDMQTAIARIHRIVDHQGLFTPEQERALKDVLAAVHNDGYALAERHAAGDFDDED